MVLGPVATSEYFNIAGTIQSTNTSMYLNVGSDTTSYKTLTFDKTASTKVWTLEGDTILTQTSSSFGRRKCAPEIERVCFGANTASRIELRGLQAGGLLLAGISSNGQCNAEWEDVQQLPISSLAVSLLRTRSRPV